MSKQLLVDITQCLHNADVVYSMQANLQLDDSLLPYYQARFDSQVTFDFDWRYSNGAVEVIGDIDITILAMCDRCGDEGKYSFTFSLDEVFLPVGENDEDCYNYSGTRLDLTQAVIDNILLNLPTSIVCRQDCKGLCPRCGSNLNKDKCNCT